MSSIQSHRDAALFMSQHRLLSRHEVRRYRAKQKLAARIGELLSEVVQGRSYVGEGVVGLRAIWVRAAMISMRMGVESRTRSSPLI